MDDTTLAWVVGLVFAAWCAWCLYRVGREAGIEEERERQRQQRAAASFQQAQAQARRRLGLLAAILAEGREGGASDETP